MERCMLAEEYVGDLERLEGMIAERKLDGTRCLYLNGHLVNRRGVCYDRQFPELLEELKKIDADLDGELCVFDSKGIEDFGLCQTRCSTQSPLKIRLLVKEIPIRYVVFDILRDREQDLTGYTLWERKERLEKLREEGYFSGEKVRLTYFTDDLEDLWEQAVKSGWEGVMLKKKDSRYVFERSDAWLKVKNRKVEAVCFNAMDKNPAGWLLKNDDGLRVQCSGRKAEAVRRRFLEDGQVEVEVHYQRRTDNGLLFQPTIKEV